MDIRDTRSLKTFAAGRLEHARQEKTIVLLFSSIIIAMAVLVTAVGFVLERQIGQSGGLSNMGTRTVLSALQATLPLVQFLLVMCLELGYTNSMLRIARGQAASVQSLRLGFDRFWLLMRCTLLQSLIYGGIGIGSVYLASLIFVVSPWGKPFMELITPMMADVTLLSSQLVLDEALYYQMVSTMVPMLVIVGILLCVFVLPLSYQLRMVNYIIIDKPGISPLSALTRSRKMMRGNCLKMLKLDLSFWWYFLILAGISLVGDADQWLALMGIPLPIPGNWAFLLCYAVSLALTFAVYVCLRNRMEVSYALAYDALKPEEPRDGGVVLGNIFQM